MAEQLLFDVLKAYRLPVHLRVVTPCSLKTKVVLYEGQEITVLDKKSSLLIIGERRGKRVRFDVDECREQIVDLMEEYIPVTEEELVPQSDEGIFGIIKKDFNFGGRDFKKLEMISVTYVGEFIATDEADFEWKTKREKTALITFEDESNFSLKANFLLNRSLFDYYKVKGTVRFESLIAPFHPHVIRFRKNDNHRIPTGIIHLISERACDLMLITFRPDSPAPITRYERYPVYGNIQVTVRNQKLPNYVKCLGKDNSSTYIKKIWEVLDLLHYDLFGPRFYGFLDVEDKLYTQGLEIFDKKLERY